MSAAVLLLHETGQLAAGQAPLVEVAAVEQHEGEHAWPMIPDERPPLGGLGEDERQLQEAASLKCPEPFLCVLTEMARRAVTRIILARAVIGPPVLAV